MCGTRTRVLVFPLSLNPRALSGQVPTMADSGVAKIVAATALISFVSAPNPVIRPQPPAMREAASLSSGDGVVTGCHGPWLALGDTLQCHPARRWCTRNGDACSDSPFRREADLASLRWVS